MKGVSVSILLVLAVVLIFGIMLSSNLTGNFPLIKRSLSVFSTPSNANVYVDDIYKGVTPVKITGLSVGDHTVRLTKTGYLDYITAVHIRAFRTTLNVTLKPIPPSPDLTISNVTFLSTQVGNTRFNVTVKNIGAGTANGYTYNVDYGDGTSTGTVRRLTTLASGQSEILSFGPDLYKTPGTYQLKIGVNTTGEKFVANNEVTRTVTITWVENVTNQTKPDLVVSNITFSPSSAGRGTQVNITAIISNNGNATANGFTVEFRHLIHANSIIGEKLVSSLSAGSKTTLTQQWNTTGELNGTHTIRVRADSRLNVTEWNENNNDRNATYVLT